ncbi:MAG: hypothetical protein Q8M71_06565 [Thermodesulfovibrionales bacterium]|nr:hypothetical protein [Thermodesulfovibrionales bacterium]
MKSSKFLASGESPRRQVSSFKLKIVFYLASCILYLASSVTADAAYRIYLKNGSTIKGVNYYEKSEGEIKFYFDGGMVGIPEADILRIESGKEPIKDIKPAEIKPAEEFKEGKTKPPEPEHREDVQRSDRAQEPETRGDVPGSDRAKEAADIKTQPAEPDKKNQEIARKESELRRVEGELLTTRARIQNLYINASSDAERSMLQQNMMRKRKVEAEKKKLEEELKALR